MKLKRFLLRYYPPGIILEYQKSNGDQETKSIDLLNLSAETDIDQLVNEIVLQEPIITEKRKPQLKSLIEKLIKKAQEK